jgi:hypothetical protein
MILTDSILYKVKQKLNKLSSNTHQEIQLEDVLLSANENQIKLIKQKASGIPSGIGFDGSRKRYEDIQNLVVDFSKSLDLTEVNKQLNQWEAALATLDPSYLFYVDSYVLADKGRCKNRILKVNPDLTKHADILLLLDNTHFKPSFEYQETFNTISSDKISIYTDGTFTPTKLHISYIRYPKTIDKEGYINLQGEASINQDCELEDYLEDELVDMIVQDLAQYTENISAAQSAQLRLQQNS